MPEGNGRAGMTISRLPPALGSTLRGLFAAMMTAGAAAAQLRAEAPDPSAICDQVAILAATETGVPLSVLKAISLNETGRKRQGAFRPWPWTVNMEGKGLWFDTYSEAKAYVDKEFLRGARSFDVGCFQINYKWHGEAFQSIEEMFDPRQNARYAARFLRDLHDELGSWGKAAGAYHSRTREHADRYQARFERLRAPLLAQDGTAIPDIPDIVLAANAGAAAMSAGRPPRVNNFPLLQSGGGGALGSLVPLGGGRIVALLPSTADSTAVE